MLGSVFVLADMHCIPDGSGAYSGELRTGSKNAMLKILKSFIMVDR